MARLESGFFQPLPAQTNPWFDFVNARDVFVAPEILVPLNRH